MKTDEAKGLKHKITYKPKEKWIYDVVESKSCKSAWIKEVLAKYIKESEKNSDIQ